MPRNFVVVLGFKSNGLTLKPTLLGTLPFRFREVK